MIIEWLQQYIFQFWLTNEFLQIILKYFDILIENLTNNTFFYNNYNYNYYNEDPNIWSKFNKSNYEKWHYDDNKSFLDIIYEETMQKVKAKRSFLTVDEFLKQQHFLINSQNYNDLIKLFDYIDPYTKQKHNKLIDILNKPQCYFLVNEQLIIFKKMYIYNYTGSFYIENLYVNDSFKTYILAGFIIIFLVCYKTYTG